MPGAPRKLIADVLCCPACRRELAGDDCACGFTCSIDGLRRGGCEIPAVEPPRGVRARGSGKAWQLTVYPLSFQTLVAGMAVLFSVGLILLTRGNPYIVAVTAIFWIPGGLRVMRILRVRSETGELAIATGPWNLLWPRRMEWNRLRAIRLRVRSYSNGEVVRSLVLEADETREVGRYLGPRQIEYVMWRLYRRALGR